MKSVVILLDTVRLNMLEAYGETWVKTPNIKRLSEKSVVFDNHWIGSAPCMPARRDLLTGKLNFLERNWGPVEPFDITLPSILKQNDVFSHIITDHHHYFELGGEGYCQSFGTWGFIRGQEFDKYGSWVGERAGKEKYYGVMYNQYLANKEYFKKEADYPSCQVFSHACDWIDRNKDEDDWMLWVEAFDPHEPFDTPKEFIDLYDNDYDGPRYIWESAIRTNLKEEKFSQLVHIIKSYAATITMVDKWLGKLLDKFDKYNIWDDTLVIFTTDHGTMLGEHNWFAKNIMPVYNEIAHIPMMIHYPDGKGSGTRRTEITQNIDVMPTILDYHSIDVPNTVAERMTGVSLMQACNEEKITTRDCALYGWFGKAVNIFDGKYTYMRGPVNNDNEPCYIYAAIPTGLNMYLGNSVTDDISFGKYLKYTDYPVYKIPYRTHNIGWDTMDSETYENRLYNCIEDPNQHNNLASTPQENEMIKKLKVEMEKIFAPEEQFARLGI